MDKEKVIKNIIHFLERTELKGIEVPAFAEAVTFLNNLLKEEQKDEHKV